jgi:hypothetical protein
MRRTGNRIVGSNPTLSANYFANDLFFITNSKMGSIGRARRNRPMKKSRIENHELRKKIMAKAITVHIVLAINM